MSLIDKAIKGGNTPFKATRVEVDVKDTEFLMRLINSSGISGSDIEQAYTTLQKIKKLHIHFLGIKEEING